MRRRRQDELARTALDKLERQQQAAFWQSCFGPALNEGDVPRPCSRRAHQFVSHPGGAVRRGDEGLLPSRIWSCSPTRCSTSPPSCWGRIFCARARWPGAVFCGHPRRPRPGAGAGLSCAEALLRAYPVSQCNGGRLLPARPRLSCRPSDGPGPQAAHGGPHLLSGRLGPHPAGKPRPCGSWNINIPQFTAGICEALRCADLPGALAAVDAQLAACGQANVSRSEALHKWSAILLRLHERMEGFCCPVR